MAMFLGKNVLGQADKQEHRHGFTEETVSLLSMIDGQSRGILPSNEGNSATTTTILESSGDKQADVKDCQGHTPIIRLKLGVVIRENDSTK
jgi:hypothetical protein